MKTLLLMIAYAALNITVAMSQCMAPTDTFQIAANPAIVEAGQTVYVGVLAPSRWPTAVAGRFRAAIDGRSLPILSISTAGAVVHIPKDISQGAHTISICVIDGPYAETQIDVILADDTLDLDINKYDPDPRTQNGPRQDLSSGGRRPRMHEVRTYPNGGFGGTLSCSERHFIDGRFSDIDGQPREWSGISPLIGRFSNLYLDYCSESGMMYLMNDWLIGSGEYQSNCYNLFGFTTGNGREVWLIKVTHDTARPVIVELNGVDVTDDTTLVLGGASRIGASPSDTTPHTMYEFGVRVSAGLFFMPKGDDPVTYVPSTTTSLECDRGGVSGYGLIREPYVRLAWFSDQGVSVRQAERYVPTSGVIGLETEPNDISGEFGGDTIRYRSGSQPAFNASCNQVSLVDGQFSENEWDGVRPASGRYSDMYVKFCTGNLHILNDWIHATEMPNQASCYNLFELYTGNGSEHWGIWVWQDPERRPTVYRNGIDVSNDTTIVHSGKAGWGSSIRKAEPHALYEFTISAREGAFVMMFADPGPASFCSSTPSNVGEEVGNADQINIFPNPVRGAESLTVSNLFPDDVVMITDIAGRMVVSPLRVKGHDTHLTLPKGLAPGRYTVQLTRNSKTISAPLLLSP